MTIVVTEDESHEDTASEAVEELAEVVEELAETVEEAVEELAETIAEVVAESVAENAGEDDTIAFAVGALTAAVGTLTERIDSIENRLVVSEVATTEALAIADVVAIEETQEEHYEHVEDVPPPSAKRSFHRFWFGSE